METAREQQRHDDALVVPLPMPTTMTTMTTTTIVMTVIDYGNDNDHDRRQTTERTVSSGPPMCPDAIKSYFHVYSYSVGDLQRREFARQVFLSPVNSQ